MYDVRLTEIKTFIKCKFGRQIHFTIAVFRTSYPKHLTSISGVRRRVNGRGQLHHVHDEEHVQQLYFCRYTDYPLISE
jgi:hypothetical protein